MKKYLLIGVLFFNGLSLYASEAGSNVGLDMSLYNLSSSQGDHRVVIGGADSAPELLVVADESREQPVSEVHVEPIIQSQTFLEKHGVKLVGIAAGALIIHIVYEKIKKNWYSK